MSINSPYVQQNNLNKCPHGFPVGTCPICSGHGGASKDKNKPRVKGEMSYNECMAVWIRMQNAKKAKIDAKIQARLENIEKNSLKRKLINLISQKNALQRFTDKLDEINNRLNNLLNKTNLFSKQIMTLILKVPLNTVKLVLNVVNFTYLTILKSINFVLSVCEKLSSLIGEIKNFIDANILFKAKKAIKTLLSLFCETDENEDHDNQDRINFKNIKEKIKKMFKKKVKDETANI